MFSWLAGLIIWATFALSTPLEYGESAPRDSQSDAIVDLGYSVYQGTVLDVGVTQYLGMRFAAPPIGNLRWRAPVDPNSTDSIQDATTVTFLPNLIPYPNISQLGDICLGVNDQLGGSESEDCLFINVFTPTNATQQSKLPVWVFIQGGGYANNAQPNYNGTDVITASDSNIIFVNFNYRVGAFGFLASEKVRADGDLNVGLLDERKALEWVQKYIQVVSGIFFIYTNRSSGTVRCNNTRFMMRLFYSLVAACSGSSKQPDIFSQSQQALRKQLISNSQSYPLVSLLFWTDLLPSQVWKLSSWPPTRS